MPDSKSEESANRLESLRVVRDLLRLSAGILSDYPDQLQSQLLGRMSSSTNDHRVKKLLDDAKGSIGSPWLRPWTPCFTAPSTGLVASDPKHGCPIGALAVTPNGGRKAVTGDRNGTLIIWDLNSGAAVLHVRKAFEKVPIRPIALDDSGDHIH